MRRLAIVVVVVLSALLANFLSGHARAVPLVFDIDYLAQHCTGIPADHRRARSGLIPADRSRAEFIVEIGSLVDALRALLADVAKSAEGTR